MLTTKVLVLCLFARTVLSSFPLTAVSLYNSLAPCAQSHLSNELDTWYYDGCTETAGITAYGSCICADRISSIQFEVSIDFEYDTECPSTQVQPFLTAFCEMWGVNIANGGSGAAGTTTAAGAPVATGTTSMESTGQATPGNVAHTAVTSPTSMATPTSTAGAGSSSGGGTDNKITIIAGVVGSVAGVIAVFIAWKTYTYMTGRGH